MSIRRTRLPFEGNFTQIPNTWLRDKRLSRRARGLLAELMSHREGFRISVPHLVANGIEGRDAVRHAINELAAHGYLTATQTRKSGKFSETEFELTAPTVNGFSGDGGSPWTEKPSTVFPAPVNPHPKNTRKNQNTSGGEEAPAAPTPEDLLDQPLPWCHKHPGGTQEPCRACKIAREAAEGWKPAPGKPKYDPTLYCEHLQLVGQCEWCDIEEKRAAAILAEQFGAQA